MSTVLYFATGDPAEVNAELERLRGRLLCVVSPRGAAAQLNCGGAPVYTALAAVFAWLRLRALLRRTREVEVVCFRSPGRFRWLKFLAWSLSGNLVFSDAAGARRSRGRLHLLRAAAAPKGAICVIGSASAARLEQIVSNLRARYPDVPLEVAAGARPWLRAYFGLLRRCWGRERFRAIVLACTREGYGALKALGWLLPVRRVEVYNENLDVFSGRSALALARHWRWRMRLARGRRAVGVIGSASGFYLKTIVADVRARFPGVPIHGLLPRRLVEPAGGLFDTVTVLNPGPAGVLQVWRALRRTHQYWMVPCTEEPYAGMKLLAFLLPFGPRQIYNELADAFSARDLRILGRHIAWRLRDRLTFKILTGTAGSNLPARLMHLVLYSLRLAAGAWTLGRVRIASLVRAKFARRPRPSVDLIYLDSKPEVPLPVANMRLAARIDNVGRPRDVAGKINAAVRSSHADFICLFDSRCSMSEEDWLERLLKTFDERTGQVGPQIAGAAADGMIRGGLAAPGAPPHWNSDHAVCCHVEPDWLEIDALPWVCLVVRRNAALEAGLFAGAQEAGPVRVDLDFCRRLAAHGWLSLCNQSVTASLSSPWRR